MAMFAGVTAGSLDNIDDFNKLKRYLYKLNEDLVYMFNNLTPEDNNAKGVPTITVVSGGAGVQIEAGTTVINIIDSDSITASINNLAHEIALLRQEKANKATLETELDEALQQDPWWEGKTLTGVMEDIYSKLPQ